MFNNPNLLDKLSKTIESHEDQNYDRIIFEDAVTSIDKRVQEPEKDPGSLVNSE